MRQTLTEIYESRVAEGVLRADPAQHAVLGPLEEIRHWLEENATRRVGLFAGFFAKPITPPRGMYLWGGVGRGKSMVMDLFTEATAIPQKRRVHFHAFMQEIHRGMHDARKRGVEDALAPVAEAVIREVRLLAFDEMQITDITDAMIVGRLFERLFAAGVVVVTTSNRHPDELYQNGLNRQLFLPFIEMIKERLVVWELTSPTDYRQDRLSGEKVYFSPADASARAAVDRLWQEMSGAPADRLHSARTEAAGAGLARGLTGAPEARLTLRVLGRDVVLPRFRNGVARVSFWDLCGQPLGPADYLAVAGAVRVLILEDIPLLNASKFNEAKRFVTLVDALYEAKVKLIATAADAPEKLYLEGSGSFEFERTASRLSEMGAAGWGD